jgi:putative protein kinase ArgK-like GTPase of G3E family
MTDLASLANTAIELFRQHAPWVAEKLGAAAASHAVKEIWEQLKKKLSSPGGQEAIQKVESEPNKDRNWDTMKNHLLDLLEQDSAFREQLAALVKNSAVQQTATGTDITQAANVNSPGASIKIR